MFALKHGLTNVSVMDTRTPVDVIEEFVEGQNELNKVAGGTSFVELLAKSKEVEDHWSKHRKDSLEKKAVLKKADVGDKTEKEPDYYKLYAEWFLANFGHRYAKSFEYFKIAKDRC
jgi:hypothetical protein